MKHRTILITALTWALVASHGALAQAQSEASPLLEEAPRHQIDTGVFIGGNFFGNGLELGNAYLDDQVPSSAFLLGLRGSYLLIRDLWPASGLAPELSVEVETKLALASTSGDTSRMRASYSAPVLGWRAHAVLSIMPERPLTPFALLGVGGETAFSSSPFVDSVDSDAAIHWGIGARYRIAPAYGVRADIRHGITAGRTSLAANTLELHVGFVYRFGLGGATPASRPDVVTHEDEPDKDPTTMPTSTDADGDGFLDEVDQCPNEAETVNHIEDTDGCPEADEDGDELPDVVDECPKEAEDVDGFEDLDGCPDRDNDKDGRSDVIDACPQEPEDINGFEDDDGCPDQIPDALREGLASIRFVPNSVQLSAAKKQLETIVALLQQHPSVNLVVSGHTDDAERKPAELSLKRANAVKAYLVSQGIEDTRLEAVGAGADKPEANNRTKLGKARNRRVDFDLKPGPAVIDDPASAPSGEATDTGKDPGDGATTPGSAPTDGTAPPAGEPAPAPVPAPESGAAPAPESGAAPAPAPAPESGAAPASEPGAGPQPKS